MELHTTSATPFIAMMVCGVLMAVLLRLNAKTYARNTVNVWRDRGLAEPDVDGSARLDLIRLFTLPTHGQAFGAFVGAWLAGSIGYFLPQISVWGFQLGAFIASTLAGLLVGYVLTHKKASAWGEHPDVATYLSPMALIARRCAWPAVGLTALIGAGMLLVDAAKGGLILIAAFWAAVCLVSLRWLTSYAVRRATLFDGPDSAYGAWRWATRAELANLASNITALATAALCAQGAIGAHAWHPVWWSTIVAALPAVALAALAVSGLTRTGVHLANQTNPSP